MPAVYGKIKKKEAYKSASYTTIQKLLLQIRITSLQVLGELLLPKTEGK